MPTWRACRYGMDGTLIDLIARDEAPARIALRRLLDYVRPDCRFVRWAAKGVWVDIFHALATAGGPPAQVLIDSSAVKAHRCASGGKGGNISRPSADRAAGGPRRSML